VFMFASVFIIFKCVCNASLQEYACLLHACLRSWVHAWHPMHAPNHACTCMLGACTCMHGHHHAHLRASRIYFCICVSVYVCVSVSVSACDSVRIMVNWASMRTGVAKYYGVYFYTCLY